VLDIPFAGLEDHIMNNGFNILPITFKHINQLVELKSYHKDPFDRIIIAQARAEKYIIIGKDHNFHKYHVKILW
jgi:PIN domain nuclease of toxin-antitoxin system